MHKKNSIIIFGGLLTAVFVTSCWKTSSNSQNSVAAGDSQKWVIRRVTTSGVCQVWDSTASPIGTIVVGGGPYSPKAAATKRMCEIRTDDANDNQKCFHVNPENACETRVADSLPDSLPDEVVKYIDTLPDAKFNIDEAILPNGKKLGEYMKELGENKEISPNDTPQDQLSKLFAKFLKNAATFVDRSQHQYAAGTNATVEPAQNGLGYNLGSRDIAGRKKMNSSVAACNLKVYGLDCSGLLFQIFEKSGCSGMNETAAVQGTTGKLDEAIANVITGVAATDKGKLTPSAFLNGDIIYWDKLAGANASHIGIVLKEAGGSMVAFQSNGGAGYCEENLTNKRGPRTLNLNDTYWFSQTPGKEANWKILRYEVGN
jgi:hypothetical protein